MSPSRDPRSAAGTSSRRDLLTRAAAAAGASTLLGSRFLARGMERVPKALPRVSLADDEPVRMGLIGAGGMGGGHMNAIMGFRDRFHRQEDNGLNVDIVAVSDCALPRQQDWMQRCSDRQGFQVDGHQDYKELIARDDIHCVLIASPEHWHAQMAIDAILAGKDVYLEKPMTLHLEDAVRLFRVVEANDQILQVGTQKMMIPRYREAKRLLEEGAIGHPTLSQTSYCRNSPDGEWNYYAIDERIQPDSTLDWDAWCGPLGPADWDPLVYHRWRRYQRYSTGIIGDLLVHQMSPMMYCLNVGWPTRVTASGGHYVDKAMENHDQVMITVEFEGGHTMIVAGSTINQTGLETMIRGHHANIYLNSNDCILRPEPKFEDDVDEQRILCPGIRDQDELRKNWLECVRSREANQSPVEWGLKHMVVVDLAARSMWEGGAYSFDPETFTTTRL